MRDHQDGDFAFELVDGFAKGVRGVVVQVAGGFVEDEYGRTLEQGAGDGDALLLAAGESGAVFADFGLVALWESFECVVDAGGLAGDDHIFEAGVGVAQHDVVVDGAGEEHGVLRHDAEVVS